MKRMYYLGVLILALITFGSDVWAERLNKSEWKEIKLTTNQWIKLNTFFSNFSEVALGSFSEGKVSNKELIAFGVGHNVINNEKLIEHVDDYNGRLSAKYVETSIEKYFGIGKVTHQSTVCYKYKNGYYIIPYGDGEAYRFSQVTKFIDIGNDFYVAYTNEFVASSGFTGDPNGSIKQWEKDDDVPELYSKIRAVIRKVNNNNSSRYILIEYKRIK